MLSIPLPHRRRSIRQHDAHHRRIVRERLEIEREREEFIECIRVLFLRYDSHRKSVVNGTLGKNFIFDHHGLQRFYCLEVFPPSRVRTNVFMSVARISLEFFAHFKNEYHTRTGFLDPNTRERSRTFEVLTLFSWLLFFSFFSQFLFFCFFFIKSLNHDHFYKRTS